LPKNNMGSRVAPKEKSKRRPKKKNNELRKIKD
jgi:hypothetical protein